MLALYDGPIYGSRSTLALNMVDASAILWRLHLGGVDAGHRWQGLADNWQAASPGGHYAFNDVHAAMAFVGAVRWRALDALLDAQQSAIAGAGDNVAFTRDIGRPATLAIAAFGRRRLWCGGAPPPADPGHRQPFSAGAMPSATCWN